MIEIVEFEFKHVKEIAARDSTGRISPYIDSGHFDGLIQSVWKYTALFKGEAVFCGGVMVYGKNRGEAWALFGNLPSSLFVTVHRKTAQFLKTCPLDRIEAVIDFEFFQGRKWAKMLGFKLEAPRLERYFENGRDGSLFCLIKKQ